MKQSYVIVVVVLLIILLRVDTANADNEIFQRNSYYTQGASADYLISQVNRTVTIFNAVASQPYRIEVTDSSDVDGLGSINLITYSGSPDSIQLEVRGETQAYGARNVRKIYINPDQYGVSSLVWIRIKGTLGDNGMSYMDTIGTIQVDGNLGVVNDGDLDANDITGSITIGGQMLSNITSRGGAGNITVNGTGTHTGSITVADAYSGTISINGPMTGNVEFQDDLTGSVTINGDYSGWFNIIKDLEGDVVVNGTLGNGISGNGRFHIREYMKPGAA